MISGLSFCQLPSLTWEVILNYHQGHRVTSKVLGVCWTTARAILSTGTWLIFPEMSGLLLQFPPKLHVNGVIEEPKPAWWKSQNMVSMQALERDQGDMISMGEIRSWPVSLISHTLGQNSSTASVLTGSAWSVIKILLVTAVSEDISPCGLEAS